MYMQLNAATDLIITEFIKYSNDPDNIDYILLTYRNYLRTYISDNNIQSNSLSITFKEFTIALVKNLWLRFSNTRIYIAMKIFDFSQILIKPNKMTTYRENKI